MRSQDCTGLMSGPKTAGKAPSLTPLGLVLALWVAAVGLAVGTSPALASDTLANLRGGDIAIDATTPDIARTENQSYKRVRNYPEQPPTIPHDIRGYQVDLNMNKCLECHSRTSVERSQAPMISITHFMDRDGQILADVSPRRYFCNQCHVTQTDARPMVDNLFIDIEAILHGRKGD